MDDITDVRVVLGGGWRVAGGGRVGWDVVENDGGVGC